MSSHGILIALLISVIVQLASAGITYEERVQRYEYVKRNLGDMIKNNDVFLLTGSTCSRSRRSEKLLRDAHIPFRSFNYDSSRDAVMYLYALDKYAPSITRLPFAFVCGKYIGGLPELTANYQSGHLEQAIAQC